MSGQRSTHQCTAAISHAPCQLRSVASTVCACCAALSRAVISLPALPLLGAAFSPCEPEPTQAAARPTASRMRRLRRSACDHKMGQQDSEVLQHKRELSTIGALSTQELVWLALALRMG